MNVVNIEILDAYGQPVATTNADAEVEVRATLPQGSELPPSIDVSVTSDTGTATIRLNRQPSAGEANPTYSSGLTHIGKGSGADSGDRGPLGSFPVGDGSGVTFSAGGAATNVTCYRDEITEQSGVLDSQLFVIDVYLTQVEIALAKAPPSEGVKSAQEMARRKRVLIRHMRTALADPRHWPRGKLYMLQNGIRHLKSTDFDLTKAIPETFQGLSQGEEEGKLVVLQGIRDLVIGFYQNLVGATGAGDAWVLMFDQTIMGMPATHDDKVDAAKNLALTAVMTLVPIWHVSHYRVPTRATPRTRSGPLRPPKAPRGTTPRTAQPGVHVEPGEFGMRPEAVRHANRVADANGVVIRVRPTNKDAMKWRELGHPGKPEELKPKTINELDTHIGAKQKDVGLLGYFEPTRPVRTPEMDDAKWSAVEQRYEQRRTEFHDKANVEKIKHLSDEGQIRIDENGVVYDTGICGGTGKAITGDYDLWDVTYPDGTPVRGTDLELIVNQLRFGDYGAQHGPHKAWVIDKNDPKYLGNPDLYKNHQKIDADTRAKHDFAGASPEAVIELGGYSSHPTARLEGAPASAEAKMVPEERFSGPGLLPPERATFRLPKPWIFFTPLKDRPGSGSARGGSAKVVPGTFAPDAAAGGLFGRPAPDDDAIDQIPSDFMTPEARRDAWKRAVSRMSAPVETAPVSTPVESSPFSAPPEVDPSSIPDLTKDLFGDSRPERTEGDHDLLVEAMGALATPPAAVPRPRVDRRLAVSAFIVGVFTVFLVGFGFTAGATQPPPARPSAAATATVAPSASAGVSVIGSPAAGSPVFAGFRNDLTQLTVSGGFAPPPGTHPSHSSVFTVNATGGDLAAVWRLDDPGCGALVGAERHGGQVSWPHSGCRQLEATTRITVTVANKTDFDVDWNVKPGAAYFTYAQTARAGDATETANLPKNAELRYFGPAPVVEVVGTSSGSAPAPWIPYAWFVGALAFCGLCWRSGLTSIVPAPPIALAIGAAALALGPAVAFAAAGGGAPAVAPATVPLTPSPAAQASAAVVECSAAPDVSITVSSVVTATATHACTPVRQPGASATAYCRVDNFIPYRPGANAGVLDANFAFLLGNARYDVELTYTTNTRAADRGALPQTVSVASNPARLTLNSGGKTTSFTASAGVVTFDADGASGTIDADFSSATTSQTFHLKGTWKVPGGCPKLSG